MPSSASLYTLKPPRAVADAVCSLTTILIEISFSAGALIPALGPQILTALHEAPQLHRQSPELLALVERSLEMNLHRVPHSQKLEQSRAAGSFSLLEFTSDGLSKRTPVRAPATFLDPPKKIAHMQ